MNVSIVEIFTSIQGESTYTGLPCTFIRFYGCNLDCSWCDTQSAKHTPFRHVPVKELVNHVVRLGMRYVCLTGGEPLLQPNLLPLIRRLRNRGIFVTVETNGSMDWTFLPVSVPCIVDVKCPSSGMITYNRPELLKNLRRNDQVKFVVRDRKDYRYAKKIYFDHLPDFPGPVFISPVHGMMDPATLAKWVISDKIPIRVHLQIHKILNVE